MKPYVLMVSIVFAIFSSHVLANISLKNGNFFIGYTDLVYSGGIEPKVERVYNSKSSHDGIFGFGWGSDYEVHLIISADGSVVMHENGGGAQNRFTAPAVSSSDIEKAVASIMSAKQKSGAGVSGKLAENEKKKLLTDARYRNDEWERLYAKGLVQPRQLAVGTVLKSNKYSYQTLEKVKDGYIRRFDSGIIQTFDNSGKLAKILDKNQNYIVLKYDRAGHLAIVQDNFNRRIKFFYNPQGKVEKTVNDNNKVALYKYKNNELIFSKDTEDNVYEYKYSSNNRHNLVEIKYSDKTSLQVGYADISACENVKWVKDRDGSLTEYDYSGDCNGGLEHITKVLVKDISGKKVSSSEYGYFEKIKPDGERYTYKLSTEVNGDKTETIYNECCGLPLLIDKNGEKTAFEYDAKGHVTKKTSPIEVTELSYDPVINKVTRVVKYSKEDSSKKSAQWSQFQYDNKGNLIFAKNSEGKGVKIVYDYNGRIRALVDQAKRKLEFTYNEASRPVEIKDSAVGKIKVLYSNAGQIQKIESAGGRKVASQVTSAFQNLLEIIRPAGVSLSF